MYYTYRAIVGQTNPNRDVLTALFPLRAQPPRMTR